MKRRSKIKNKKHISENRLDGKITHGLCSFENDIKTAVVKIRTKKRNKGMSIIKVIGILGILLTPIMVIFGLAKKYE